MLALLRATSNKKQATIQGLKFGSSSRLQNHVLRKARGFLRTETKNQRERERSLPVKFHHTGPYPHLRDVSVEEYSLLRCKKKVKDVLPLRFHLKLIFFRKKKVGNKLAHWLIKVKDCRTEQATEEKIRGMIPHQW